MKRIAVACALAWCAAADANPDGAPPAHTGAFGEPNCHACHFDGPEREPGGPVRVLGLPARIAVGATYELFLEVETSAPSAGFQLTVRDVRGRQAGTLAAVGGNVRVVEHEGIQYLGHTDTSSRRWGFLWHSPDEPSEVVFAGAVNAANDDQSEFGDEIYLVAELMMMERARCD